jgi:hypothetical protein
MPHTRRCGELSGAGLRPKTAVDPLNLSVIYEARISCAARKPAGLPQFVGREQRVAHAIEDGIEIAVEPVEERRARFQGVLPETQATVTQRRARREVLRPDPMCDGEETASRSEQLPKGAEPPSAPVAQRF